MNYGRIKYHDIADGPGVRVALFVSGCRNACKGCFNPETWDFGYGEPFTAETEESIIEGLRPSHIRGFTLIGGDPFEPENAVCELPFMERLRALFPDKSFWAYTGYTYEHLAKGGNGEDARRLLGLFDVLVDGRYVEELNDMKLRFRGSSNQRVIDLPATRERGEVVPWDGTREP